MTENSYPWPFGSGDGANPYSAEEWRALLRGNIGSGDASRISTSSWDDNTSIASRGVLRGIGNDLRVIAGGGLSVDVQTGAASVRGFYYTNDAAKNLAITGNGTGNPRIDLVVLQADWTAETVRLAVKIGTPAASPTPPSVTQTDGATWEIPIAEVDVAAGAVTITSSDIRDRRQFTYDYGIVVDVYNAGGSPIEHGTVVKWTMGTVVLPAIAPTSSQYDIPAGVVQGRIEADSRGLMMVLGVTRVNFNTTPSLPLASADPLPTVGVSTSAGEADLNVFNSFGVFIQNASFIGFGSSPEMCFINCLDASKYEQIFIAKQTASSGTDGGGLTGSSWNTRSLNTTTINAMPDYVTTGLSGGSIAGVQPGVYEVEFWAVANRVANHKTRLYNVTAASTLVVGSSELTVAGTPVATRSTGRGIITLSTVTTLRLEHYVDTTRATDGQGVATTSGEDEVYAYVKLKRIS